MAISAPADNLSQRRVPLSPVAKACFMLGWTQCFGNSVDSAAADLSKEKKMKCATAGRCINLPSVMEGVIARTGESGWFGLQGVQPV